MKIKLKGVTTSTSKTIKILGKTFLYEKHYIEICKCSYCNEFKNIGSNSFGFLSPVDKSWNSWRRLFYKTFGVVYFIRWTLRK